MKIGVLTFQYPANCLTYVRARPQQSYKVAVRLQAKYDEDVKENKPRKQDGNG